MVNQLRDGAKSVCLRRVVFCRVYSFTVFWQEKCHKKQKETMRVRPGWIDISGPGPVSFLFRSSMQRSILILQYPTKPLNVRDGFSRAFDFISPATWCKNELRPHSFSTYVKLSEKLTFITP